MIIIVALAILFLSPFIAEIFRQLGIMSIRNHNNQPTEVWVRDGVVVDSSKTFEQAHSEAMDKVTEQRTGYCKYCDSLIESEDMIRAFNDEHRLVWVGCLPCYNIRLELMKNANKK